MTVSEDLYRAHAVLVERGWCQDAIFDAAGRVCAAGAISIAMDSFDLDVEVTFDQLGVLEVKERWLRANKCRRALGAYVGTSELLIEVWNDLPVQTEDAVLDAFLGAAKAQAELEALS